MSNIKKGYKQTDIGVIPEDWEVKEISSFANITSGGTPSTSNNLYWGGTIRWMNSGELNLKLVYEVEGRITEEGLRNSSTKFIPKNCVLIGLAGQGKTRGTAAINLVETCINQSIGAIFPSEQFDYKYLYYYIDNKYLDLRLLSSGDGGRGGLTKTLLSKYKVALPLLEEQTAIATVLSDTDALIAALDKKIAKKQQIKQGAMQQLLTGKKRLPGFSGEWVEKRLGDVFFVRSGYGFPISFQGNKDGVIPFYKVSDMNNVGNEVFLSLSNNYISEEDANKLNIRQFKKGSIIFAKIGAAIFLERKRIASCNCSIDNNMMALEKKEDSTEETYFYHLLNTMKLSDLSSSSALPSLSSNTIENMIISIPNTKTEQTAIAQILTDMDNEIAQLEKERKKYKEMKAGMMQVLLTGKIRLI